MECRLSQFQDKEVICAKSGIFLGYVDDIIIETCSSKVIAIVIYGKRKCFGLLGREDDIIICWNEICVIGEDAVLINTKRILKKQKRKINFFHS